MSSPPEVLPATPPRPSRRRRVLRTVGTVVAGLVAVAAVAAAVIHVPYIIESPGAATALNTQVVTVTGARTYQHRGRLLYLTVEVTTSDPNLYRYFFASLTSSDDVVKKQDVLGCASYNADARLNTLLMVDSQNSAKEVALSRLGYPVPPSGARVLVVDLQCGGPSDHHLQVGDLITAVDGMPVSTDEQIHQVVVAQPADAVVHLTVRRGAQTLPVTVHAGRSGHSAFLGITIQTLNTWRFPLDVRINTQSVGGPSAGLAFTLALVNALSPGMSPEAGRSPSPARSTRTAPSVRSAGSPRKPSPRSAAAPSPCSCRRVRSKRRGRRRLACGSSRSAPSTTRSPRCTSSAGFPSPPGPR